MNRVTASDLGRRIVQLLSLQPKQPLELIRTKEGSIIVRKIQEENV